MPMAISSIHQLLACMLLILLLLVRYQIHPLLPAANEKSAYTGDAAGHFGDSIQYVDDTGALKTTSYSSTFGCSHNTGIGLEAADAPPFASVCAEDHGAIWLNTDTQYMSGVKIANENTTNGVSGEPSKPLILILLYFSGIGFRGV